MAKIYSYSIYKTTNLVNGKFYWGVHDSIDENDGYLGSGKILRRAIKKYGKENFRRVTKLLYRTAKEAYRDEAFIVNKAMVENPMCYNMHPGGHGGDTLSMHPEKAEIRARICAFLMGNTYGRANAGIKKRPKTIKKMRIAAKKKFADPAIIEKLSIAAKKQWANPIIREKMCIAIKAVMKNKSIKEER